MRLKAYITENTSQATQAEWEKRCKKMIDFYNIQRGEFKVFFWRGVKNRAPGYFSKYKSHIKDRKPMSTGPVAHEFLNDWFTKKFGWPARNGVATTSEYDMAAGYGHPMVFFPADPFEWVWSPKARDLWGDLPLDFAMLGKGAYSFIENIEQWLEITDDVPNANAGDGFNSNRRILKYKVLPLLESFKKDDLLGALKSGHETLFKCKDYYMVESEFIDRIYGEVKKW